LHNDWTLAQLNNEEYPQPDIRGPIPQNAHPDSTFSSHLHNDWTLAQLDEYPQPDIRGPIPQNAHPDSTFSSHLHNDWTLVQESDDSEDDEENVQLEKFENFLPNFDGAGAQGGYERTVPSEFMEERDDRLMHSLIKNYSLEMKDMNGAPSGHFFFDKAAAEAASNEVVHTHFKYNDSQTNFFMRDHFNATWEHFDVNNDNLVEVERMPQFLRYLLGDALVIGL